MLELLTTTEMGEADRLAVAGGRPGRELMERAGAAVAFRALEHWPRARRIVVLAGPGNNGGDGYVAARHLERWGRQVVVAATVPASGLRGDAKLAADDWRGATVALRAAPVEEADLVIDALFGAGLTRPLEGDALKAVVRTRLAERPVLAIDIPSGVDGTTGAVGDTRDIFDGPLSADLTVTFFRRKPGHVLMPARARMGRVRVADIGIPDRVLDAIAPRAFLNRPGLWMLPPLPSDAHKYSRGAVLVASGPMHRTGAARLAARAALRSGAGLVTVAGKAGALPVLAEQLTSVTIEPFEGVKGLATLASDRRIGAVLIGPAYGIGEDTRASVLALLRMGRAMVLDADALTSFEETPNRLFAAIKSDLNRAVVMTPHDGEFQRLFGRAATIPSRLEAARRAAAVSGATVVSKGPDTVVASPDGRAAVATNGTVHLATAGSGDVLAGMVASLLAQDAWAFSAACAAVWLHGEAGRMGGPGLIAEDLPDILPRAFAAAGQRIMR